MQVSCFINNLETKGLAVRAVHCRHKTITNWVNLEPNDEDNWQTLIYYKNMPASEFYFFRVFITGMCAEISFERFDKQMGHQIWCAREEKVNTDFTFVVGEESFSAHKCILIARSPYFRYLFSTNSLEISNDTYIVQGADSEEFSTLLHFIYTGELHGKLRETDKIAALARQFEILSLVSICDSFPARLFPYNKKTLADSRMEIGPMQSGGIPFKRSSGKPIIR